MDKQITYFLPEQLENVPCDFCNSTDISKKYKRRDGMQVVECANCGLAYLNPRPRKEFISDIYNEDYFTGALAEKNFGGLKLIEQELPIESQKKKKPRVIELIDGMCRGISGKKVLEIGCATGDLLLKIKNAGAEVKGLEVSEFAANKARNRGLDVDTGTVEKYSLNNINSFDIVIALEVIEHVISPMKFLKSCSNVLHSEGYLILSTPNYGAAKRFGEDWFGFQYSFEHIYFFSLDILKKMAEKNNFKLVYWETSKFSGRPNNKFFYRRLDEIVYFLYLLRHKGIVKAIDIILHNNIRDYHPYGFGHTLLCIFQK